MGALGVVGGEVIVQHLLHLVNGLEPRAASLDVEVLVEEGAVEALDDAVGLWAFDPRGAMLVVFELLEEFVRVLVGTPAELTAIVTENNSIFALCASKVGMTSWFMV